MHSETDRHDVRTSCWAFCNAFSMGVQANTDIRVPCIDIFSRHLHVCLWMFENFIFPDQSNTICGLALGTQEPRGNIYKIQSAGVTCSASLRSLNLPPHLTALWPKGRWDLTLAPRVSMTFHGIMHWGGAQQYKSIAFSVHHDDHDGVKRDRCHVNIYILVFPVAEKKIVWTRLRDWERHQERDRISLIITNSNFHQ